MGNTFQGNSSGPSYTSAKLTNMKGTERRDTKAFSNTEDTASAIRGANKRRVTKEQRKTGRI